MAAGRSIAMYVSRQFGSPIPAIRFGDMAVLRAAVVEAAVGEDRQIQGRNNNIWLTRQAPHIAIHAPAMTKSGPNELVKPGFRTSVTASDPGHVQAALLRCENVSHLLEFQLCLDRTLVHTRIG
jgi:hypothetical protein